MLRGGAFKPRTSPYAFQGLGLKGLKILEKAKKATGLPIVTEIKLIQEMFHGYRNMQIYYRLVPEICRIFLIKEMGRVNKPILLKKEECIQP